jgi:hypothetical protein
MTDPRRSQNLSRPQSSRDELRQIIRAIHELTLELAALRHEGHGGSDLAAKEHMLERLRWRLAALARRLATDDRGVAA